MMENWQKIEIIIRVVEGWYKLEWKVIFGKVGFGSIRADIYRLTMEFLQTRTAWEYLNVTKPACTQALQVYPETPTYNILRYRVKNRIAELELTIKKAS